MGSLCPGLERVERTSAVAPSDSQVRVRRLPKLLLGLLLNWGPQSRAAGCATPKRIHDEWYSCVCRRATGAALPATSRLPQ